MDLDAFNNDKIVDVRSTKNLRILNASWKCGIG